MITKISHTTLFAHNKDEAANFYEKKFGFKVHLDVMYSKTRWVTLNTPDKQSTELVILLATTPEEKKIVGKQSSIEKPFLCFITDDCQEDYEQLTKLGVEFVQKPMHYPWGNAMTCLDLYGNLIYIWQPF